MCISVLTGACGGGDDGRSSESQPVDTASASGSHATTTSAGTPVAGGSANFLVASETGTLDPVKATGSAGNDAQRMFALYGALMTYDAATAKTDFLLADSFVPSADLKSWTLKLKPNLTFTDGSPFDAAAVKANWERCQVAANASPARGVCAAFSKLEVDPTNPLILTVTNAVATAHLDKSISRSALNYIASKKALDDKVDFTSKAVGAGPFKLDSWTRDSTMVMSKNPSWTITPVYLDKITLSVLGVDQQRIDAFTTGGGDALWSTVVNVRNDAQKESKDAYQANVGVTTGSGILFNTSKAPFDDVRVRQAILRSIPLDTVSIDVQRGAEPLKYYTVPGTPQHTEESQLASYDLAAAQKLVDDYVGEHGGQPIKFTYYAFQVQVSSDLGKFVVAQLGKLKNVQVDFQVLDTPTATQKALSGDFSMINWGFPTLDPDPGLYNMARSGLATNYGRYANATVDKLLDDARASTDNDRRFANYKQVYAQLAKDVPFIPTVVSIYGWTCSARLRDCQVYEDGILRFDKVWKAS